LSSARLFLTTGSGGRPGARSLGTATGVLGQAVATNAKRTRWKIMNARGSSWQLPEVAAWLAWCFFGPDETALANTPSSVLLLKAECARLISAVQVAVADALMREHRRARCGQGEAMRRLRCII
jgi:hypothetical protein